MPLYINETIRVKAEHLDSFDSLFTEYSMLKEKSKQVFNAKELKTIDCQKEPVLYVLQGEFAIVSPSDDSIEIIVTDDTTTCITGILRHCQSGVSCLIHYDRPLDQFQRHLNYTLDKMIVCSNKLGHKNQKLNPFAISNSFDLYLIGGYCDERNISEELAMFILREFSKLNKFIVNLCCTFIGELSTEQGTVALDGSYGRDKVVPKPVIYGAGIKPKTGEIFNAVVERRRKSSVETDHNHNNGVGGVPTARRRAMIPSIPEPYLRFLPMYDLRRAAVSYGDDCENFTEIYDTEKCAIKIEPVYLANISALSPTYYNYCLTLSDEDILFKFSTSPYVEPEHFKDDIRAVLQFVRRHHGKNIRKIYFPAGVARYFRLVKPDTDEQDDSIYNWKEISF